MIEILLLLSWLSLGAFIMYKTELTFAYAMHVKYTLTNPVVKLDNDSYFTIAVFSLSGLFSLIFFPVAYNFIPKDDPNRSILKCFFFKIKNGQSYKELTPLDEIMLEISNAKRED